MDVVTYAALKSEIDALGGHIEEDVAEATEAWLEENVDPDTGYVLDRTLAMENAAAPADMVGDLKTEINDKLTITHGKNLLNPADKIENVRMYAVNTVGSQIKTTSSSGSNIIKVPVIAGETYTISHVTQYVFGDKDGYATSVSATVGNYAEVTVTAPLNSTLLWIQSSNAQLSSLAQVEEGNKRTFYEPYIEYGIVKMDNKDMVMTSDIQSFLPDMEQPTVVNPSMTKDEFIIAFNTAMASYAAFNEAHIHSFPTIPTLYLGEEDQLSWDYIFYAVNANLRKEVVTAEMSMETACHNINKALTEKIYRFSDARLSDGNRKFSLSCNFQADEPSAIVVDEKLYVYAHLKRVYTEDGVSWSEPEPLVLSDSKYILHVGINYIDGVYYMIGTDRNEHGDLLLYTSTDGVNFTYMGILFEDGVQLESGASVTSFGNPYLIKEYGSGKFYLYIEVADSVNDSWVINLAIYDDFTTQNQDGTIGSYTLAENNPVLIKPLASYRRASTGSTSGSVSAGNPDFAKGEDNRPIKHDGKYYMYLHSTWATYSSLLRASSVDLVNWDTEWVLLDNRDIPSAGEMRAGNADACVIEYKGRTYLFYSYDINDQSNLPYIKYTVDDRPFHEMLGLRP